jgi:hypothetical protein
VASYQYERLVNKYDYEMETFKYTDTNVGDRYVVDNNNIIVTSVNIEISNDDQIETIKGLDE